MNELKVFKEKSVDLISEKELASKLKKKKKLIIKAGFDPSRPDLHLGHYVLLRKLKQFQDLGHKVVFVVGDFTAMIGDPSGQNELRPVLSKKEVSENAKTYEKQVFKVLDPKKTKLVFNTKWFNSFKSSDLINLSSHYTIARLLERDDFKKRYKTNKPIFLHEFIYPLIQAYDSVVLKADIEVGGSDQKFNLIVGREIQKSYQIDPQVVITYPLLEGLCGVKKMSKSLDNYIGINEEARQIFGKMMKISDELMFTYYSLLTDFDSKDISDLKKQMSKGKKHPKLIKKELAMNLVSQFYSSKKALEASQEFDRIFSKKALPDHIDEVSFESGEIWICHLLKKLKMTDSTSKAKKLIESNALSIDQKKIRDSSLKMNLKKNKKILIQLGKKKFLQVKIK